MDMRIQAQHHLLHISMVVITLLRCFYSTIVVSQYRTVCVAVVLSYVSVSLSAANIDVQHIRAVQAPENSESFNGMSPSSSRASVQVGMGYLSVRFLAIVLGGSFAGMLVLIAFAIWLAIWVCKSNKLQHLLSCNNMRNQSSTVFSSSSSAGKGLMANQESSISATSGGSSIEPAGGFFHQMMMVRNLVQVHEDHGHRQFTLSELSAATHAFHEHTIIGKGSNSLVYSGLLSDGRRVAIKKPLVKHGNTAATSAGNQDTCSQQGRRASSMGLLRKSSKKKKKINGQYINYNEHEILGSLNDQHEHIVKMVGCCLNDQDADYSTDNDFARRQTMLVFEMMEHGSLRYQLHEGGTSHGAILGWEQRLTIALQVSKAISFLHFYANPCTVIHGNISSDNILLDCLFNAKLGGFGFATHSLIINYSNLVLVDNDLIYPTNTFQSPTEEDDQAILGQAHHHEHKEDEAMDSNHLTDPHNVPGKSVDVYCFGLVLLELLTGKKPWEIRKKEWVENVAASLSLINDNEHLQGDYGYYHNYAMLVQLLDARLFLPRGTEGALKKALELAIWCCSTSTAPGSIPPRQSIMSDHGHNPPVQHGPTIVDAVAVLEQVLCMFKNALTFQETVSTVFTNKRALFTLEEVD